MLVAVVDQHLTPERPELAVLVVVEMPEPRQVEMEPMERPTPEAVVAVRAEMCRVLAEPAAQVVQVS
jgi:hypothetical protein